MKEQVIAILKSNRNGLTPTEIGLIIGKSYAHASASVSPVLKKLTSQGKVKRWAINGKVKYCWIFS